MESQFESSARWPASEQQLPNAGKKPPTRKLVIENRPGLLRIDYGPNCGSTGSCFPRLWCVN